MGLYEVRSEYISSLETLGNDCYRSKKIFKNNKLKYFIICYITTERLQIFIVRLCVHGRWETIIVDDFFPSYEEGWCFVECKKKQV
jgi:hypothetical protein